MSVPAAFFDVDGTIVASNIVRYGVEIRTQEMSPLARRAWTAAYLPRVAWLIALDRVSRERFQRSFYHVYGGTPTAELDRRAERLFEDYIRPRIRPQAAARVAHHRERGHRVVLVSGSIEPIVQPLASHLGIVDVIAARLESREGSITGALESKPLAGERKAEAVVAFALDAGLDLGAAFGYADSRDDVPMLERLGHAAVVNPDPRLERLARNRGWDVYRWPSPAEFGLRPPPAS